MSIVCNWIRPYQEGLYLIADNKACIKLGTLLRKFIYLILEKTL